MRVLYYCFHSVHFWHLLSRTLVCPVCPITVGTVSGIARLVCSLLTGRTLVSLDAGGLERQIQEPQEGWKADAFHSDGNASACASPFRWECTSAHRHAVPIPTAFPSEWDCMSMGLPADVHSHRNGNAHRPIGTAFPCSSHSDGNCMSMGLCIPIGTASPGNT